MIACHQRYILAASYQRSIYATYSAVYEYMMHYPFKGPVISNQ